MNWLKGHRTIIMAVVGLIAAKVGLHLSDAQTNIVVDSIPDLFAGLMIIMRLFTTTPIGAQVAAKVETVSTQIDPVLSAQIKTALDDHGMSISTVLDAVGHLQSDMNRLQNLPTTAAAGPPPQQYQANSMPGSPYGLSNGGTNGQ